MKPGWKWLLGLALTAVALVATSIVFLVRAPGPSPMANAIAAPAPVRESSPAVRESAEYQRTGSAPVAADDTSRKIAELSRQIEEVSDLANRLADNQKRLEALMQNLSLSIDGSNLKLHTAEEQQAAIAEMNEEVEKRRKQVTVFHDAALQAAREAGVSEDVLEQAPNQILVLPPGRDYTALVEARARVMQAAEILRTAETELVKLRMQKVLRDADGQ
jgi:uncharacterized protein YeeX (DUF496 family)